MKRTGNVASNRIYNPQNAKPPIPFDADEADSAMERFIRTKYQEQGMGSGARAQAPARHYSGSTESDDLPPPLPPKEKSRFGFRSASSIFPMSSKAKREAAATAHLEAQRQNQRSPSPPLRNKPSRVFSSAGDEDDLETKLAKLRDMGFSDDRRNITVLKGLNGNVEKAVEALVRLGEGSSTSRSRTPLTPTTGISTGLKFERQREVASPASSNNPWDMPAAPLQSSQSTGNVQAKAQQHQQTNGNPFHPNPSNPFGLAPSQSQYNLNQQYQMDQAFQNLSMGQPQSLFPNHTGGFADRQPFQQAPAPPPMPSIPQNYAPATYDTQSQQQYNVPQNYNPFMQQQQTSRQLPINTPLKTSFSSNPYTSPQSPASSNPYTSQQLSPTSSNPFGAVQQSPISYTPQNSYFDPSNQQQQQAQALFNSPIQQQQMQTPLPQQQQQQQQVFQQHNPFNMPQPQQVQIQPQQQYGQYQNQQFQQLLPQQTGRADKTSILALYNHPQLAPIPQAQVPPEMDPNQNNGQNFQQQQQQNQNHGYPTSPLATQLPQRSFSSPLAGGMGVGNNNPFMVSPGGIGNPMQVAGGVNGPLGMGQQQGGVQARQISRESVMVDSGGWHGQNGRHSPDAFANLSARS